MTVRGVAEHRRRLQRIRGPEMVAAITAEIFGAAKDIANDAALSITTGATSAKDRKPSEPGTPPNAHTGVLDRSIDAVVVGPLKAEVHADAPYAAAQEFGSEKQNLPERPYLRPAAERGRAAAQKRVVAAVKRVVG